MVNLAASILMALITLNVIPQYRATCKHITSDKVRCGYRNILSLTELTGPSLKVYLL